jgi:hypothetical protein
MDTQAKRLVPIPETRQVLGGIGHTTVYALVKSGEIVKVNIGRRGFITSESLEAYMDRLSAAGGGDAATATVGPTSVSPTATPSSTSDLVDLDDYAGTGEHAQHQEEPLPA